MVGICLFLAGRCTACRFLGLGFVTVDYLTALLKSESFGILYGARYLIVGFLVGDVDSVSAVKNHQVGVFVKCLDHFLALGVTLGRDELFGFGQCNCCRSDVLGNGYEFAVMLYIRAETTYCNSDFRAFKFTKRARELKQLQNSE